MVNIPYFKDKRIIIIEGIAGSGKNTIQERIKDRYNQEKFRVYDFSEEDLLFSWKHFWIENMEMHRIRYLHSLLDYCEKLIDGHTKTVIILNRFHITYAIVSEYRKEAKKLYDRLVDRLRGLPVHIFIGRLGLEDIEKRASHSERKDEIWRIHQQKRIKRSNVRSLSELYKNEQEAIFKIAEKQGIPYSVFEFKGSKWVLKDGDLVEVDARTGRVTKIKGRG
ncbi:MAG TPA: hypothetical protein VJC16_05215 [Candidatus Nanoarchaeia archaeon]|nr:hypothetical protein [Candidatus Nanoarchaeia archaeon]